MNHYLPEGMGKNVSSEPNPRELLDAAIGSSTILQATALLCDEAHNLIVDLGQGLRGIIPKDETAIGIRDGSVRDIAILSLVGRPVCFHVVCRCGETRYRLSRYSAQSEALRYLFRAHTPGDILPAVVTALAPFGAFCDIACGVTSLLSLEHISVSRVPHPGCRFAPGDRICAVIRTMEPGCRRISLSHRELLGTWTENAAGFHAGQTVTGVVRSIQSYGAFIELTPNLSGLCEPDERLSEGDAVSVYIKSINPEKYKIKLTVIGILPALPPKMPPVYVQTQGRVDRWEYSPKLQSVFLTSSQ